MSEKKDKCFVSTVPETASLEEVCVELYKNHL